MGTETIEALIEGGNATAAPPLGPALGPLGVDIGNVISSINDKTSSMEGMQVPVKVIVDTDSKDFEIEIGTPPAKELITEESDAEQGSGDPNDEFTGNITLEGVKKIAKLKADSLLGKNLKNKVKEIVGTCDGMGITVEEVQGRDFIQQIDDGEYDEELEG